MRTALLAAVKRTENGDIRALLPLVGRCVLGWQLDLALRAGCERIICISESLSPEILSLQHECEGLGHEFHTVRNNAQIAALVRTGEEVLAIGDGFVLEVALFDHLIGNTDRLSPALYCIRSDNPLAHSAPTDFQRIDAEHCWAGMLTARAESLQNLAELPADSDAISALVRIVLQSGAQRIEIDPEHLLNDALLIAESPERLSARGRSLIESAAAPPVWSGPGEAMARLLAQKIERSGLMRTFETGVAVSLVVLTGATALAWGGLATFGLGCAALGSFIASFSNAVAHLRTKLFERQGSPVSRLPLQTAFSILPVLTVIGALALAPQQIALASLPILTFGLVWLAGDEAKPTASAFWSDRTLHLTGLAIASAVGLLSEAVAVLGLAALGHKLLRMRRK